MARLISTTALAKQHNLEKSVLFSALEQRGFIERSGSSITLTRAGEAAGGGLIKSQDYGTYVGWPADFDVALLTTPPQSDQPEVSAPASSAGQPSGKDGMLTATAIGKHFGLSANKCNYILSELGWINKSLKGWLVTKPGERLGGSQSEDFRSGVPYVRWPAAILVNKALVETMREVNGLGEQKPPPSTSESLAEDFRAKFPATHRAADGHMVRSRAEMLIDNWLYMAEIVHAYERKLPIEEDVYCDFYIPTGKVYIEFWGLENDPKYQSRKAQKKAIYEKYGFNLIELGDADVQNLDDILPRHLLKFGVQAY